LSRVPTILVITAALLGAAALWHFRTRPAAPTPIPFSLLEQEVRRAPARLPPQMLQLVDDGDGTVEVRGHWKDGVPFASTGVVSEAFLGRLRAANLEYELVAADRTWTKVLALVVPPLAIVLLLFLSFRRLRGGRDQLTNFGRSTAKAATGDQRKTTFADVAGIEEARGEVEEIIGFLKDPSRFSRLGGRIPKGVLMMGPPGTGKTLLARAIAGEAGVPFFSISGSDFVQMFVGVGASRVRSLFEQGKQNAPCIIFVDEIDAVGRRRGAGVGWSHDEREQTLNQLLVEMDGFAANEGVIVLAATNRPDGLDPALLRAGRFDRRIVLPAPDVNGRLGILQVHTRKTPLAPGVDLRLVAQGTSGMVGADLANLVNEAALLAARADKTQLDMADLEGARDKVLMGPERRSMVISPGERRAMAYRQAGHALVGKLTAGADPIHKVTIIPRGDALGITQRLPSEDRLSMTEGAANDQLAFALGGRVAEELVFGRITTGSAHDLEAATELARRMVCEWGMSARIGPISLALPAPLDFLGSRARHAHPEGTAVEIDGEIRRLVMGSEARARQLVEGNLDTLRRIAEALLDLETIDGAEVDVLMAGGKLARGTAKPPTAPLRS
jgi:cell division protease FtsH